MPNTQPTQPTETTPSGTITRQRRRQAERRAEKGPSPWPAKGPNRHERRRKEALLFSSKGLLVSVRPAKFADRGVLVVFAGGAQHVLECGGSLAAAILDKSPSEAAVVVRCVQHTPVRYQALRMGALADLRGAA